MNYKYKFKNNLFENQKLKIAYSYWILPKSKTKTKSKYFAH